MTIHQRVEEIEKALAEEPPIESLYRGIPVSNFSHDALVQIIGKLHRMYNNLNSLAAASEPR